MPFDEVPWLWWKGCIHVRGRNLWALYALVRVNKAIPVTDHHHHHHPLLLPVTLNFPGISRHMCASVCDGRGTTACNPDFMLHVIGLTTTARAGTSVAWHLGKPPLPFPEVPFLWDRPS